MLLGHFSDQFTIEEFWGSDAEQFWWIQKVKVSNQLHVTEFFALNTFGQYVHRPHFQFRNMVHWVHKPVFFPVSRSQHMRSRLRSKFLK
jgi:hypothetical protein